MEIKLRYIGHATFTLEFNTTQLIIDPYFANDPFRKIPPAVDFRQLRPKYVFITHEHFDHCDKNAVAFFVKKAGAKVIGPPQLERIFGMKIIKMRAGQELSFEGFTVRATPALHPQSEYPIGFLFDFDGFRIWHAGDTYYDEKLLEISTDVALLPIGGKYTMGPEEAAELANALAVLYAIPMHYGTFEELPGKLEVFMERAKRALVLKPGEVIKLG